MKTKPAPPKRGGILPIDKAITAARQQFARHYGVHPYFTRRPANVVKTYIERYSLPGDRVLDPFGGSGVTAIESMLAGRLGIHNDVNPFANFIAECIGDTTIPDLAPLHAAFRRIEAASLERLQTLEAASDRGAARFMSHLNLPKNIRLPKTSDAEFFYDLFTPKQLAGLAVLKEAIDKETVKGIRNALLLAWSASVAKLNRTFLSAKGRAESRGGSSIFSIYRYKLARNSIELPIWETFKGRFLNVIRAKEEVLAAIDHYSRVHSDEPPIQSDSHLQVISRDAASLSNLLGEESVDYIFTDPPYGAHIAYLDLSVLWNHWLGFEIGKSQKQSETIVGGSLKHSEDHYKTKLAESVTECAKLLKPDRWFSIVFQHWDPSYFAAILTAAAESNLELKAAITHEQEVIWSMHKKKNSETVLAGEMILTFFKPALSGGIAGNRRAYKPSAANTTFEQLLDRVLVISIKDRTNFSSEFIFNQIILQAWKEKALPALSIQRKEFMEALRTRGWRYDSKIHEWTKGQIAGPQPMLFDI